MSAGALDLLNYFGSNSTFGKLDSQSLFALDAPSFAALNRSIGRAATSEGLDWIKGESVEHLSYRVAQAAESVLSKAQRPPNANLIRYVYACMIVNWVRSHVYFDAREEDVWRHDLRDTLDSPVPATVCGGSSWLCAQLGAFTRKTCLLKVEGRLRGQGAAGKADHSWGVLKLPSSDVLFADAQHSRLSHETARGLDGYLDHPLCFGLSTETRALFISCRYQMIEIEAVVDWSSRRTSAHIMKFAHDPYSAFTIERWAGVPTSLLREFYYRMGDTGPVTWRG